MGSSLRSLQSSPLQDFLLQAQDRSFISRDQKEPSHFPAASLPPVLTSQFQVPFPALPAGSSFPQPSNSAKNSCRDQPRENALRPPQGCQRRNLVSFLFFYFSTPPKLTTTDFPTIPTPFHFLVDLSKLFLLPKKQSGDNRPSSLPSFPNLTHSHKMAGLLWAGFFFPK